MRGFRLAFVLTVAVLLPNMGNAQVFQFRTPPPDVTAAGALWEMNGDPIMVGGITYDATRAFRLFDGQVMVQTGLFAGVPVYSDATIEPYSELYVPLSSGRMRVYERRRERELAGTTGSHVPTFPVDSPSVRARRDRIAITDEPVGTGGSDVPRTASEAASAITPAPARPRHTIMTAVPSGVPNGVWLEFNGRRWYSDGPAASFSADRFEPIGEYRGFPVYRDKTAGKDDIWVSVVEDGPLAPYRKQ
ncbi:MAG: hypothetical protein JWL71_1304 [Acidobacteria bacterium]|nr:hypothetical protein [Acidobacteriota bacterium]